MKLPVPAQLSFDFGQPSESYSRNAATAVAEVCSAPKVSSCVIDLTAALRRRQEDKTRMLYRQILGTVKHFA